MIRKEAIMIDCKIDFKIDVSFKSSLYKELQVQEILWTPDDDKTDRSRQKCIIAKRRRQQTRRECKSQKRKCTAGNRESLKNEIDGLSNEILLKIFGYLDKRSKGRCCQVSQRWWEIGCDHSLWKSVQVFNKNLQVDKDIEFILKRGVLFIQLRHCHISSPNNLLICKDKKMIYAGQFSQCSNHKEDLTKDLPLQCFDASVCVFEKDSLCIILERCKHLRFLSLQGTMMSDRLLKAISNNPDLRELNFAMCKGITASGITMLTNGCKKLASINLSWSTLSKEILMKIVTEFPNLEEINFSGNKVGMDDEVVKTMVLNCPHLKVLDLSDCLMIGDDSIDSIKQHTALKKISLSRCHRLTATKICEMAKIKTLQELELFGFTNQVTLERIKTEKPEIRINVNIFSPIAKISKDRITL